MGVSHHHAGFVEDVPLNQVGGFPAHTGEFQQILHGPGDPAAEVGQQHLGAAYQIPALSVVEAAGVDVLGYLGGVRCRKGLQRGEAGEESGGDLVDPGIGTLGGEPDGEQQFVVFLILQGADAVGIEIFQPVDNGPYILGGFHGAILLLSVCRFQMIVP